MAYCRCRKTGGKEDRVVVGDDYFIRVIVVGKVCAADEVIVLLDLPVLARAQHFPGPQPATTVETNRSSAVHKCPTHVHRAWVFPLCHGWQTSSQTKVRLK